MADGLGFREGLKDGYEKFKALKGRRRWIQFRQYYLWKSLLLLIAVVIIISFIRSFIISRRDVLISGALINTALSQEGEEYLSDGYFEECKSNSLRQRIQLSATKYIEFDSDEISYENSANWTGIYAQISAKDIDYMIVDEDAYQAFGREGIYAKLSDVLSKDTYKQLSGQVIDNQAINLKDSVLTREYSMSPQNAYLVFVKNGTNLKEAESFIKYLFP